MYPVEELLLLRKKLAQLRFLKALGKEVDVEDVERKVAELEGRFKALGMPFTYLYGERIKELEEKLSQYTPQDIAKAASYKQGPVWELLKEKAELVNKNLELKRELAFFYKAIAKGGDREKALRALAKGEVEEPFEAPEEVAKALYRLGLKVTWEEGKVKAGEPTFKERRFVYRGEVYWLPENLAGEFEAHIKELDRVSLELQRLNAVKQARDLTEEEEKAFAEAQKKLLELLAKFEAFGVYRV